MSLKMKNRAAEKSARLKLGDKPSLEDWKSIFTAVMTCVDPTDEMVKSQKGFAYIYAQAMRQQNPDLYEAMEDVSSKHASLMLRLNEKRMAFDGDEPEVLQEKRRLNKTDSKISFEALCDSHQYGMRGRVRELVHSFKRAMEQTGEHVSELDRLKISQFIERVETLSQPAFKTV